MENIIKYLIFLLVLFFYSSATATPPTAPGNGNLFTEIPKSADSVALITKECANTVITNRGWDGTDDQTFHLPESDNPGSKSPAGLRWTLLAVVASGGTADTYIDTEGSTTDIYLDGVSVGDGQRVWTQEIAVGESISCYSATLNGSTYEWFCDTINGTWLDKGS